MHHPSPSPAPMATPNAQLPAVRTIEVTQSLKWLVLAWQDMAKCGWLSYAHGLAMTLAGAAILLVTLDRFWLMAGALSGFLVVAPVLATSLYALSRALERGEKANLNLVVSTWLNWQKDRSSKWGNDYWAMIQFGVLLALAGTGWVMTSAALITLLSPVPINSLLDFIHHVVLARDNYLFEIWMVLGGMLAAPIFASTVVAMPLLLDRRVTLLQAVLTSWRVVLANPVPMAFWAALLLGITLLGLGSALLGLVVVIPLLGHASWHAYRDLVDVSALPERNALEKENR